MLRRPPTSISLSNRDIKEHLDHINDRKTQDRESTEPRLPRLLSQTRTLRNHTDLREDLCSDNGQNQIFAQKVSSSQATHSGKELLRGDPVKGIPPWSSLPESKISFRLPQPSLQYKDAVVNLSEDTPIEGRPISSSLAENFDYLENPSPYHHREQSNELFPPSRSTFDCGGFVETQANDLSSLPHSCPFDILEVQKGFPTSTPTQSQGINSANRVSAASRTPYVTYEKQELLLSQPAKPRNLHGSRIISYSFEESERANAAYEDIHESDNDSNSSSPRPMGQMSLREELRGSSLHSASAGSITAVSPPDYSKCQVEKFPERKHATLSSAQLPLPQLPPPFSAVPRRLPFTTPSPSASGDKSDMRFTSATIRQVTEKAKQLAPARVAPSESHTEMNPTPTGALRNLASLPFRLFSAYRSHSPVRSHSGTSSSGSSPAFRRSLRREPPMLHRQQFPVYNDQLAVSMQPQTPQNLPEARHQSRYHPSFTAPSDRRLDLYASQYEMTRHRRARSHSPVGIEAPGFDGLYGGRENGDDEAMFDRAARRLWAHSPARIGDTSNSNMPEGSFG